MTKDSLGDRMKKNYEDRARYLLPRRTNTILRIDGKSFHSFTRHCVKPFDSELMFALDAAAIALCQEMMGCRLAYGQSDEYSFVLTDYSDLQTEAWFDGNLQKIVSVAVSIFTASFAGNYPRKAPACFDCRAFIVPELAEVENYFIWRQQDSTRNAIQSLGQAHFSQKQLHGVTCDGIQELLFKEKGVNFNDQPTSYKRGRVVKKEVYQVGEGEDSGCLALRSRWIADQEPPVFTQDREYLRSLLGQQIDQSKGAVKIKGDYEWT